MDVISFFPFLVAAATCVAVNYYRTRLVSVAHHCWVTFKDNEDRRLVPHSVIATLPRCLQCMITGRVDDVQDYPSFAGPIPYFSGDAFELLVMAQRFPDMIRCMDMSAVDDLAHVIAHVGSTKAVEERVHLRYKHRMPRFPEEDSNGDYEWTTRASFRRIDQLSEWIVTAVSVLDDGTDVYYAARPRRWPLKGPLKGAE